MKNVHHGFYFLKPAYRAKQRFEGTSLVSTTNQLIVILKCCLDSWCFFCLSEVTPTPFFKKEEDLLLQAPGVTLCKHPGLEHSEKDGSKFSTLLYFYAFARLDRDKYVPRPRQHEDF